MKKRVFVILLLAILVVISGCGETAPLEETAETTVSIQPSQPKELSETDQLIAAAKEEGVLTVYNSCEEEYMAAVCGKFEELYGIDVQYQNISQEEAMARIIEEDCQSSVDVWFGGSIEPYMYCAEAGLLEAYEAENAAHLLNRAYRDQDGYWYGTQKQILGFMINTEKLEALNLPIPTDWSDLLLNLYERLIWMPNFTICPTSELIFTTVQQLYGSNEYIRYLSKLDMQVQRYPATDKKIAEGVAAGECAIGVGMLDAMVALGQGELPENVELIIPDSGMTYILDATAILKGCPHSRAAKLWIEFILSPEFATISAENEQYHYMLVDHAQQHAGFRTLDHTHLMDYDFRDAWKNGDSYMDAVRMELRYRVNDRFQTE